MRSVRTRIYKLFALTLLWVPVNASATVFEFVCDALTDCDGDSGYSFVIELADSVITPNGAYSTGSDGATGILGWSATSNVGNGFSISGSGGLDGIAGAQPYVGFTFDGSGILTGMYDTTVASNTTPIDNVPGNVPGETSLIFHGPGGWLLWFEPNAIVGEHPPHIDPLPPHVRHTGHFAPASVPAPPVLALIGIGLLGLRLTQGRKKA